LHAVSVSIVVLETEASLVNEGSYLCCVRLWVFEREHECSEHVEPCSDRIRYVLKTNKKTEQS